MPARASNGGGGGPDAGSSETTGRANHRHGTLGARHAVRRVHAEPLRSALQKHLKGSLSTSGATYCRFVYAVPLALAYVALLGEGFGLSWPAPDARFAIFAMLGGITQITATALLVVAGIVILLLG